MPRSAKRALPRNILQEYLQALAEGMDAHPTERQRKLLHSYAELQYQLHGGRRCSMCRASVRHVLPVKAEHIDGTIAEYVCLCTRCLESERFISHRVTLRIGRAHLEYARSSGKPNARTFRASAP
jgi:bacterioferritin-associated ferredoxin